ncbi:hypothetical protein [Kineosporia sp. R_H_3]|uniref:hypothetical protein n=1 Tax=Kineosporia sp. R_H_3 TaxID=1961848 RepID=UPI000B4AC5C8|nr:hypothetical protein [Kineosporia sp. R_H_3]
MSAWAPIGAPAIWLAVVDRDGGRCTCTGACGTRHHNPAEPAGRPGRASGSGRRGPGANAIPGQLERCPAGTGPTPADLLVVPVDPTVPDTSAWKLAPTALTTRCPACARRTRTRANRPTHTTQPTEAGQAHRPDHARTEPRDLLELLAAE